MSQQTTINLKTTEVYHRNNRATAKTVINRGGAGSSKSYSLMQLLTIKFLTEKKKKFLISRKTLPSLRASTHEAFLEILDTMGVKDMIHESKQHLVYKYGNNTMRFISIDDPEKVKSSNYSYIFMEEATEFDYQDYLQLKLRLREPSVDGIKNQLFMAFNPIDEFHWIKEKVLDVEKNVEEIHSTYKDNPYLDDDYIEELENFISLDRVYYEVYALGKWGRLENLIYRNWESVAHNPPHKESESFYGLDFGYNDPMVMVMVTPDAKDKKILHVQELVYESNLTTADLIRKLDNLIPKGKRFRPVYCDSAEPDRIEELKRAGYRAMPAKKAIMDGIDFVKRHRLIIPSGSTNILKELQAYSWKMDKNKNIQDEPIDFMNHAMDAIRYAIYTHLIKNNEPRFGFLSKRRRK